MNNTNNNNNNYCPQNNMSQQDLLNQIMALNFAVNDLVLYLDTHPCDSCAIRKHNEYSNQVVNLTNQYQSMYGPLTVNFDSNQNRWQWSDEPWPWERGAY